MSDRLMVDVGRGASAWLIHAAVDYVRDLPDDALDRYDNPFESKLQVPKQHQAYPQLGDLIAGLHYPTICARIAARFGLPELNPDRSGYHTGVFVYRPGDRLQLHVDSVIHDGWRKVATANLYLTACAGGAFRIGPEHGPMETVQPEPGTLAVFTNDDDAFHEVTPVTSGTRIMITTGYLVPADSFQRDGFTRTNERAWFVPSPGEVWTPEQIAFRDRRGGMVMA